MQLFVGYCMWGGRDIAKKSKNSFLLIHPFQRLANLHHIPFSLRATSWKPFNDPYWSPDPTLGTTDQMKRRSSSWFAPRLFQDALKGRRVCSTFLYCFDREAQLLPLALKHDKQSHAGTFTRLFHLTFDAGALGSQVGSTGIDGRGAYPMYRSP